MLMLAHASLVCLVCFWHTSPREEEPHMNDRQKDTWAGVLLGLMFLATLVGGLLVLKLTLH